MKYKVTKEEIVVDKLDFSSKHIFECGQVFRYKKIEKCYRIISGDKSALIEEFNDCYKIYCSDINYFINYFDLDTDYQSIKLKLNSYGETIKKAIDFGQGIRILNQQPLETIINFIISANNNIKRIQQSLEKLSTNFGTNKGDFYAFPTLQQLSAINEEQFRAIGVGFRAKYLVNTVKKLQEIDFDALKQLSTDQLIKYLITFDGIGPKVADCVALFGYHKMDVFPVDTWVEKVYNCYFAKNKQEDRRQIRTSLLSVFGELGGYAQQYLFYYKRELDRLYKTK